MAFEKTGWITNVLWKTGPKGGKYLTATVQVEGEEPRDQSVFGDFMDAFVEANEKGRLLDYTIEKPEGSRYWNVTKASLAELDVASPETQRETSEKGTEVLKDKHSDPTKKAPATGGKQYKADPDKTQSIEAQVFFKGVVELVIADKIKINCPLSLTALAWGLDAMGATVDNIEGSLG